MSAVAVGVVAASTTFASAEPGPSVNTYLYPGHTFSPNGDGYDDELEVDLCPNQAATITTKIVAGDGSTVRSFPDQTTPGWCADVEWDGTDASGDQVPDGAYVLQVTAVLTGGTLDKTVDIVVDRRVPATLTKPVAGTALGAQTQFELTPADGFDFDDVTFAVGPEGEDDTCSVAGEYDDGTWTAQLDATSCGVGDLVAHAELEWGDDDGGPGYYRYTTPDVPVIGPDGVVRAVLRAPMQQLSPDNDGNDDSVELDHCVVDTPSDGPAHETLTIQDATGHVVRTLVDDDVTPVHHCAPGSANEDADSWDGADDAGDPVADGRYSAVLVATNDHDPADQTSVALVVDSRAPAALTSPAADQAVDAGSTLTVTPTAGFDIQEVDFDLRAQNGDGCYGEVYNPGEDGTWSTAVSEIDDCGPAPYTMRVSVYWADEFGHGHTYRIYRMDGGQQGGVQITGDQYLYQGGDFSEYADLGWCITTAQPEQLAVLATVQDSAGQVVRTLADRTQGSDAIDDVWYGDCGGYAFWNGRDDDNQKLPDGSYTIHVDATEPSGNVLAASRAIQLDSTAPAVLVKPTDGTRAVSALDFELAPADGVDVVSTTFFRNGTCLRAVPGERSAEDGHWRATMAVGDCSGTAFAYASVVWRDSSGRQHSYSTPTVQVTTGAAWLQIGNGPSTISPNGDGYHDAVTGLVCVYNPIGEVTGYAASVVVRSAAGDVVRHLSNVVPVVPNSYNASSGCLPDQLDWPGTDDGGAALPDGDYQLVGTAIDGEGSPAGSTTIPVTIDSTDLPPGELVEPVADSKHSDSVTVAFKPRPGATFDSPQLYAYGCGAGGSFGPPDADGVYRYTLNLAGCASYYGNLEQQQLSVSLSWLDQAQRYQNWTIPRTIRVPRAPQLTSAPGLSTTSFSPNDDDQEDELGIGLCAVDSTDGGDLTSSVVISDQGGAVVRTLTGPAVPPSSYCSSSYSSSGPQVAWDGTDDAGQAAPDGTYTVQATVTDPDGASATGATRTALLDRRLPASVVEPADGVDASGLVQFGLRPTAGVGVYRTYFGLWPELGNGCTTSYVSSADLDGVFRAPLDTVAAGCGDGPRTVYALAYWQDSLGGYHETWVGGTGLTLTNPVHAPTTSIGISGNRTFSPNGDGYDDTASYSFCIVDSPGGGAVQVTVEVHAAGGALVRTLVDDLYAPTTYCPAYYDSWDGLDAAGQPVPDGQYTLSIHAVDPGGLDARATSQLLLVDQRVPGSVTSPAEDAVLAGTVPLVFSPTSGFDIRSVSFSVVANRQNGSVTTCSGTTAVKADDGTWQSSLDASTCGVGKRSLVTNVSWRDSLGGSHSYSPAPVDVVLPRSAPSVTFYDGYARSFSPNGDNVEDQLGLSYCVQDDPDRGTDRVVLRVTKADGTVVRTLAQRDLAPSPRCDGYYYGGDSQLATWDGKNATGADAPDGEYTVTLSATDGDGVRAETSVQVTVDRRLPGAPTSPVSGDLLAGVAQLVYTPTDGFALDSVTASVSASNGSVSVAMTKGPDGVFRGSLPVGQLTSGSGTVYFTASWTDAYDGRHSYYYTVPVTIDTAALPLTVYGSVAGTGPYHATLGISSSDARSTDLTVTTDWGDGSAVEQNTLAYPYATLQLNHDYQATGTYYGTVKVTNDRGGSATKPVTFNVTDQVTPNTPPTVQVATTPTSGTAPLVTSTSVQATDAEDDPLTYTINFGDGSTSASGSLPHDAIAHTFTRGGVYVIRTVISDGRAPVVRYSQVTVALDEPLVAVAGDDQTVEAGAAVSLDGSASRPALGISRYHWDFGDGTEADGMTQSHPYAHAGTYHARLTVYAGQQSTQDELVVTVTAPSPETGLAVTVKDDQGRLVTGADVLVQQPDGGRISAVTNASGVAHLHGLPDGYQKVFAAKSGYLPGSVSAQVTNDSGEAVIQLKEGQVASATLESQPLTHDQIVAAGIDPDDPENQNVSHITVALHINGNDTTVIGYVASGGDSAHFPGDCPTSGGVQATCSADHTRLCLPSAEYTTCGTIAVADGQPQIGWIVMPGKAKWLKEFFSVTMMVTNLAVGDDFVLDHGTAALTLPAGLSLAPTTGGQSLVQAFPNIAPGGSQSVQWLVRGDAEGNYPLTASYAGALEPIGTATNITAVTQTPLHVWGGSALKLTVLADDQLYADWDETATSSDPDGGVYPYHVTVRLENVADVPIYDLDLGLSDDGANVVFQPEQRLDVSTPELAPGDSIERDYIVLPPSSGALDLASSFVGQGAGAGLDSATVEEQPAPDPATVPVLNAVRGVDGKVLLTFDGAAGASAYRFYTIDGPQGPFVPVPAADVHPVDGSGTGVHRYWLSGLSADEATHVAISSVVAGVPTLVHRVAKVSTSVYEPKTDINLDTKDGTGNACYSTYASLPAIGNPVVHVGLTFGDEFGLASVSTRIDNGEWVDTPANGATSFTLPVPVQVDLSHSEQVVVWYRSTNLAGDTTSERAVTISRDCAVHKAVVVAMGLNSSLRNDVPTVTATPPDCDHKERGDHYLEQAATNACDDGTPNTDDRANLLTYLQSRGYDAGIQKASAARDFLEYSYEGAEVSCVGQDASFLPKPYSVLQTYRELANQVLPKRNDTAVQYFEALAHYDYCWRKEYGERLEFTVLGHSLGGYETLGLLKAAHDYRGDYSLGGPVGREDLIAGAIAMDGALQPEQVILDLNAGDCATSGGLAEVGLDLVQGALSLGPLGRLQRLLGLANYVAGPHWSTNIIRDAQEAGIRVATVTNSYDHCLYEDATLNDQADFSHAYKVDLHGSGKDGHGAILTKHNVAKDRIVETGYPVLGAIKDVLGHTHGALSASQLPRAADRGAARAIAGASGQGSITGRLLAGAAPTTGAVQALVDGVEVASATAEDDGQFAITDLPDGSYRLYVSPTATGTTGSWVGGADQGSATVFTVTNGSVADAGDVAVTAVPATTLTVVTPAGAPVHNAAVGLFDGDDEVSSGSTGADGKVTLQAPPTGDLTVVAASVAGYVAQAALADVRAAGGQLELDPVASVQVKITADGGAPLSGVAATATQGSDLQGIGITNSDGVYTFLGVPAGPTAVTLSNPADPDFAPVTLHVQASTGDPDAHQVEYQDGEPLTAPSFPATAPPAASVGTPYTFAFAPGGSPAPVVTLESGSLPAGLTLAADGKLTGTPTESGQFTFSLAADNIAGSSTSQSIHLNVWKKPAFLTAAPPSGAVGTAYSYQFSASGFPDPTYSVGAGQLPGGLALSQDGRLSGTPTEAGMSSFSVLANNSGGSTETTGLSVTISGPGAVVATAAPVISGTARVGSQLSASGGVWSPADVSIAYQWLADGTVIPGATTAAFTPAAGQVGKTLTVRLVATRNGSSSGSATSAPTAPVAPGTITVTGKPKISGRAKVGKKLKVKSAPLSQPGVTISYQWLANGKAIKGATATAYKLTAKQKGRKITVRVTVTAPGYSTLVMTSAASKKVV